jgi:hypothetical protein
MQSCPERNVVMDYLAGHYSEDQICAHLQGLCEMMKMGLRLIDYELLCIKITCTWIEKNKIKHTISSDSRSQILKLRVALVMFWLGATISWLGD